MVAPRAGDGRLEHLAPAGRVHRQQLDADLGGDLGGAPHRLGDVVQLEIEEDALVALVQLVDERAPFGDVQLEPDLVALDGVAERVDLLERGARVRMIERDDQPLARAPLVTTAPVAPARRRSICLGTMVASLSPRRLELERALGQAALADGDAQRECRSDRRP